MVPPVTTYFTDEALPPDGHIKTDPVPPSDYLLQGLWPAATKEWFVWDEGEEPRAIRVAVDIEKLCEDHGCEKLWYEKIREFVKFKAPYDEKKVSGRYIDPHGDWPFDPCHPREMNLPGDLPALYALLCRFHDWIPGFDQLFSEGNPAVVEFLSKPDFEQQFEQRSVDLLACLVDMDLCTPWLAAVFINPDFFERRTYYENLNVSVRCCCCVWSVELVCLGPDSVRAAGSVYPCRVASQDGRYHPRAEVCFLGEDH